MTVAAAAPTSPTLTGTIRACLREDLPDVTRLFDIAFFGGPGRCLPKLEAYLTDLFFDAPCQADSPLHSYVHEDADGRVGGFIGTHPRAFIFEHRPITAAAYGQLMVRPDLRGRGIARELCRKFYDGGQVFGFGTTASRTKGIDLGLGAHNPPFYGLSWHKVVRLGKCFARRLGRSQRLGVLRHLVRPFVSGGRSRTKTLGQWETPDLRDVETVHRRAFEGIRLHPAFDARDLEWKLHILRNSDQPGTFAHVVRDGRDPIGWYVWRLDHDGTGTVVEMLATPGRHAAVLDRLAHQARDAGAESIGGFCSSVSEAVAAQKAGASLSYSPSTYIIHSHDVDVLRAFLDSPPHLSMFDGDGWLDFPRG